MKKALLSLAAMAMMGMMMTSCQKDEGLSKETFTATTESSAKTHLDGLSLKWDNDGESIMVKGEDGSMAEYFATSVTNDNTCATFACQAGSEVSSASYQIYYPASMLNATAGTLLLPATQEYAESSVKGFPMYAETQSHAFQFTNLCGVFRLQLQKTGVSVSSISITTNKTVNGEFEVSTNAEGAFQVEACTTNNATLKTVTLDCGAGVSIDDLIDFNIYLPVGEYSTFDITITATDGSVCTKSLNGSTLAINRNERVTLTRQGEALEFVVPAPAFEYVNGLFSIDATHQVYFAKGNLQNINGEWRFAEHQYDYLGTYSSSAWDFFGWSTDNTTNNFGMSTSTSSSDYSGDFVDWGTTIGDGQTWRTLSYQEWHHVIWDRRNAETKRGFATVCNKHGMVLLPDVWIHPAGCPVFNSGFDSWTRNRYNETTWPLMEAAGAVFLPAAGYRFGTEVDYVGTYGIYWSSTPVDASIPIDVVSAWVMLFFGDAAYEGCSGSMSNGAPVRLVQNAN